MSKCYVKDVIAVANKYVGYLEKKSDKQLEDFKANAGDKNYTIFAKKFKELTGINNQGYAWCDMYVDTIFAEAFGKDNAQRLLGGFSGYTPTSASYFQKLKEWYTNKPKVGDIIFFKNSTRICHTGIIYKVSNTMVYTIEGNTSNGTEVIPNGGEVCKKSYVLTNPRIAGYGRPKYDIEVAVTIEKPLSPKTDIHNETSNTVKNDMVKNDNIQIKYYIVKKGDSLSKIAKEYNIELNELLDINNIKHPNTIDIGQKIIVGKYKLYKVVSGDSLSKISKKILGDSDKYKELMDYNNLDDTTINVGQVLKIPVK